MKAYEVCPICSKNLIHITRIRKPCVVLDEKNFSFVESICNHSDLADIGQGLPTHLYIQIVSLYGDLLYEKIDFPTKNYIIIVNYVSRSTELTYYSLKLPTAKKIKFKKVITLDYPELTKVKQKIKTLALFL